MADETPAADASRVDPPALVDPPGAVVPRELVIPEGFGALIGREYVRWQFTRPVWVVAIVVVALMVPSILVLGALGAEDPPYYILIAPLALVALVVLSYFGSKRSFDVTYPAGSVAACRVDGDDIESTTAVSSGRFNLRTIRSAHVTANALFVVLRGSRAVAMMPRALFSPAEIDHLQRRVAELRGA